jgi:uncharacterized protein
LRFRVDEVMREPGAVRTVEATITAVDLDAEHELLVGDVDVVLSLTTIHNGLVAAGHVDVPWATRCRRCLAPVRATTPVAVDELYQRTVTDRDAFAVDGHELDLAPMVRAAVLLELSDERLCRPDCAGLCPSCGTDRNVAPCSCVDATVDDRWAVLDQLEVDP